MLGAVLDTTCAHAHPFEKCAHLFPTFWLRLPLSVRDELFGNGFHARIGAAILPASSSGCEWYCLPSASQHHVDGQISGHYIPTVNDWEWIPRSCRGRALCGVAIRVLMVLRPHRRPNSCMTKSYEQLRQSNLQPWTYPGLSQTGVSRT